ncbi:TPA: hypothetical protein N2D99_002339 [Clostridium botulinum]|nr:hypothetical protein [Clostridium botulinum]
MVANTKKNKNTPVVEDKEPIVLKLQEEGFTRRQIADKLYSGNNKSRIDCLRKYMTKRGYILDRKNDKYIMPQIEANKKIKKVIKSNLEETKKSIEQNINCKDIDNSIKPNETLSKEELKEVKELLKYKENILKLVKNNQVNKNTNIIRVFEGDLKVKSIKIYKNVAIRLEEFIKNNKGYKQQDILTTAIAEYLDSRIK